MCHLLNKRQAVNSDELVILFLNSVLTHSFSLGKPYITRKIYLYSFHKKKKKKKSVYHFKFFRVRYVSLLAVLVVDDY
jgi:hypothetical protein